MSRAKIISNCEKNFLLKSLTQWTRLDGRAFDEFRNLNIEFGRDLGCCIVSLGKTRVLAQVSCEVRQPKSSRPSEGILNVNVELNPMASPDFDPTRQSELSVLLNRQLEKCLKDSKAVDLESLCIKMNEKVWAFRVDVNVLNQEGNILDCASVAALAALAHFKRPDVTADGEEFKIHSNKERDPIPTVIHHYPITVTYGIFKAGEFVLADPNLLEEGVADAFLTLNLNAYKELCGLNLGGKAELTPDVILKITSKAANRAGLIVQQIKDAVADDNAKRQERQPVGFDHNMIVNTKELVGDLSAYLDEWQSIKTKGKKKFTTEKMNVDKNLEGEIEEIGRGTAALVPTSNSKRVWEHSDDEDEDDEEKT